MSNTPQENIDRELLKEKAIKHHKIVDDTESFTILIVDDDKIIMNLISNILSKSGYKTLKAFNGIEALKILEETTPDLILLDIMMPLLNGYETIKKIQESKSEEFLPIIFITAKSSIEDLIQCFDLGAVDYIKKPFNSQELLARVGNQIIIKKNNDIIKKQNELLQNEISERKAIEEALRISEKKHRILVESATVCVYTVDGNGEILSLNSTFETITGWDRNEFIGKNFLSILHPDDVNKAINYHKRAVSGEQVEPYELRVQTSNGKFLTAEFSETAFIEDGVFNFLIGVGRDITEKKIQEEALMKSEEMHRFLVSNSNDVLSRHLPDSTFFYVTPSCELMTGFDADEIIGRTASEFVHPDDYSELFKAFDKIINEKTDNQTFQYRFKKKDNSYLWVETSAKIINDLTNGVKEIHCTTRDIHNRKLAELEKEMLIDELNRIREKIFQDASKLVSLNDKILDSEVQLQRLNAEKDKFFSIIAHDLRSPLAGIMGLTENLLYYYDRYSPNEVLHSINLLNDTAKQIHSLLENLLIWSRINRGVLEFEPETINIKLAVYNNVSLLNQTAVNKKIQLISNINENIYCNADLNMLNTVIRNLLSNAIKFTKENGTIIVFAEQKKKFATISIKDSGIGMTQDVLDGLFNINVHHTTKGTANEKGTGLGLILCQEMVRKLDGRIWVESIVDEGSTFFFTLPLADNTPEFKEKTISSEVSKTSAIAEKINSEIITDDINQQNEELQIQADIPIENIKPVLEILKSQYLEQRDSLLKSKLIRNIKLFAKDIDDLGNQYNIILLNEYAQKLSEFASVFSIENISKQLHKFDELIEKLEELEKK